LEKISVLFWQKRSFSFEMSLGLTYSWMVFCCQPGWPDWANFHLLGDFVCTFWHFFENFPRIPNSSVTFINGKRYVLILAWATFWAIFLSSSSGHPAAGASCSFAVSWWNLKRNCVTQHEKSREWKR
jgi:hypothetical protein